MQKIAEKIKIYYLYEIYKRFALFLKGIEKEDANLFILTFMSLLLYLFFFCVPIAKSIAGPVYVFYCLCYGVHLCLRSEKKYLQKPRLYYILLLVFLISGAMSLGYTPDLINGLKTLKTQAGMVWIPVLIESVSSRDRVRHYLYAYVLGGGILAALGIYEGVVLDVYRPPSIWHAVHGSHLLTFAAVLSLALVICEKKNLKKIILICLFSLQSFALYLNGTRGSWVALAVVLIIVPFVMRNLSVSKKFIYLFLLSTILLIFISTPAGQKKMSTAISDIKKYQTAQSGAALELSQLGLSFGPRFAMWSASISIYLKNPILGAGIGSWEKEIAGMIERKEAPLFLNRFGQPHNMYLEILSTRGIIGLCAFMAVILFPIVYAWRRKEESNELYRHAVIYVGIVFMISGISDTLTDIRWSFLSYISLTGVALAILARPESIQEINQVYTQPLGGNSQ
jgi:O-antigen ligase